MGQGGGLQLLRPGAGRKQSARSRRPAAIPPGGWRRRRSPPAGRGASWPAPWRGTASTWGGPAQGGGGPQVLHPQVVIGTGEDLRPLRSQQGRHHSLAAGGEGHPFVQKAAQARPVCLAVQAGGRRGQGGRVPASLPKERTSTTPQARSRATAPVAKDSAEEAAHTVGSSSTRSAPRPGPSPPGSTCPLRRRRPAGPSCRS